ncbi:uncharacterized protein NG2371_00859 [Nocardia gamkensis]|uniref:DUF3027 domain-containing protein n=1 Tax=Nocardia gamkensis TaxID=352869 RepID=A0A7X6L0V6_9NOCA|nr:DUF3027 domain-containing protein [Nocardia gamkensis]NQE66411.1 uncharacterized protein [Nocardia gamkensis]
MRPILADAVDLARRALLELEPSGVGAHLGVIAEDESAATHRFAATLPGYRGWQWAVVVAAPPGAGHATVSESALLPGPEALVAPEFVPWEQRVRPGDLAPGDLLAPPAGDPRLVPGYVATGDPVVDEVAYEIGLGRTKVLSREGREEAAERWYAEHGPDTEMAKAAPGTCGSCGFYLPLAGALRAAFGVCGNVMGADGQVVHVAYGCGAHSDTEIPTGGGSPLYEAYDDAAIELISLGTERSHAQQDSAKAASTRGERRRAVAENAVDALDAAPAQEATEVPTVAQHGVAEGPAAVESEKNTAVAEGSATVEAPSAPHAQPTDTTATTAPDATGAEVEDGAVGDTDPTDSSVRSSVRATPGADDIAEPPTAHGTTPAADAGPVGAAENEPNAARGDIDTSPALGTGEEADSPAAADESGSDIVSADEPSRPEPSTADAPVAEHDSGAGTDDAPEAGARPEIQSSPRN